MVGAVLTWREHFHSNLISEHLSALDPQTQDRMVVLIRQFTMLGTDPDLAQMRAIAVIDGVARREGFILAFSDCFFLMGVAFLGAVLLVFLLRRADPGAGSAAGAH
jgi:DHA2 family multidrug resistance protein